MLGQDGFGLQVVAVDDAHPAAPEQHAFPGTVFGKAGVLAGADVVGGKIGKYPDVVPDAGDPVHFQPQAGNLHHAGVTPGVRHLTQQPLQVAALGRCVVQCLPESRPANPVGADESYPAPRRRQHRRDQVGGGGLAFGAGNADHCQPFGRLAIEPDGQLGQSTAAVGHLHHGQIFGQTGNGPLADDARRARCGGLPGKVVAVGVQAGQADKQCPRRHGAGIITQAAHLGAGVALQQYAVGGLQKLT